MQISTQTRTLNSHWLQGEIELLNSNRQRIQTLWVEVPRWEYQEGEKTLNQLSIVLYLLGISLGVIIPAIARYHRDIIRELRKHN